ncbi:hypothetical protein GGP41_008237 [Bipolaris sorokiniana]|uniref:Uncharacterized protein n=1 Tax=Cochliobolus sativus TaxID=45130 RepID=A0A8H6DY81_COCSA|nr:hypothetical protein GGP41_008237 [Bipolaris sorokiniana]
MEEILHQYSDVLCNFVSTHANRWNTQLVKDIVASRIENGARSKSKDVFIYDFGHEATSNHYSVFQDSDLIGSFDSELMEHNAALSRSLGTERATSFARKERAVF